MRKIVANTIAFLLIGLFAAGLSSCTHEHAFTQQVVLTPPTCLLEGKGYFVCPEDGTRTQDMVIPALGHHLAVKTIAPTCTEQGYDIHYCTRCGEEVSRDNYVEAIHHDYVTTVVPPTCTEEGYTVYECVRGDDSYIGDYVPELGHDYVKTVVPPACLDEGYDLHRCSRCGDTYRDHYVESLGHDLIHHPALEPTCDEHGHKAYDTCSRCDYSTYEDIPPFDHHYRKTIHAPSCTEGGHTHYQCLVCGEEHDGDFTQPLDHDYVDHPGKKATCDEAGYKAYHVCSRCGDSNYEEIPALGGEHDYAIQIVEPTISARGYTLHVCRHCGSSYKTDFVAPKKIGEQRDSDQAIEDALHPEERVYSRRDDDFYYYAVYLGRISNYVFHNLYEFTWSENMETLGTYPKEPLTAKPMDVLEKYQDDMRLWGQSIGSTLLNAIPFAPKNAFQALYDDDPSLAAMASQLTESNGEGKILESVDPSLASLAGEINAIPTSYSPGKNTESFEEGVRYAYAAIGDLDLYVAAVYDIANDTFKYRPCSILKGSVREVLLASTDGSFDIAYRPLDVTMSSSAAMTVPSSYATNHPLKTFSYGATKINVVIGGSGTITYSAIPNAVELFQAGYDRVCFDVSWTANCGGGLFIKTTEYIVQIANSGMGALNGEYRYSVTKGTTSHESFRLRAYTSLIPDGVFKFYTVHRSGYAYDVTPTITAYLYNSTAESLGAYADSPIG